MWSTEGALQRAALDTRTLEVLKDGWSIIDLMENLKFLEAQNVRTTRENGKEKIAGSSFFELIRFDTFEMILVKSFYTQETL